METKATAYSTGALAEETVKLHRHRNVGDEMLVLDVGCGNKPKGDVNVDLYKALNPQIDPRQSVRMQTKRISNFVLASGEHLPFKPKTFMEVHCHGTIEHTEHPIQLLRELIKVCKGEVHLSCPHRLARQPRKPLHKWFFSCGWFNRVLLNYSTTICTSTAHHGSLGFLDSFNPLNEIHVTIFLRSNDVFDKSFSDADISFLTPQSSIVGGQRVSGFDLPKD